MKKTLIVLAVTMPFVLAILVVVDHVWPVSSGWSLLRALVIGWVIGKIAAIVHPYNKEY